jgi:hypothetical protein
VHAYNSELRKVTHWSQAELTRLREVCEPHRETLARGGDRTSGPTLIARIDALLEIVRRQPNLFVAATP